LAIAEKNHTKIRRQAMQSKNKFTPKKLAWVCAVLTASMSPMAHAVKFEMDNGITGSFDSTLSFGMQKRLKSPNTRMIGDGQSRHQLHQLR
jgi:hypothetical protein